MPIAEALASSHVLALSPTICTNLNRCLADASAGKIDPHQNDSLWVFQLWLQVYFSTLQLEVLSFKLFEAMGLELAPRPLPAHSVEGIFKYFFGLKGLSNEKLQVCRRRTYPSSIILSQLVWEKAKEADLRSS
ncbi:hypothetical protein ACFXTH_012558 [Malus domestica]